MGKSQILSRVRIWLGGLSFRTGAIVAGVCVLCYVVSFAHMALPIPAAAKVVLWVVFYGLAKTTQYAAIFILGKEGVARLRRLFRRRERNI